MATCLPGPDALPQRLALLGKHQRGDAHELQQLSETSEMGMGQNETGLLKRYILQPFDTLLFFSTPKKHTQFTRQMLVHVSMYQGSMLVTYV